MRNIIEKMKLWQIIGICAVVITLIGMASGDFTTAINGNSVIGGNSDFENTVWEDKDNHLKLSLEETGKDKGFQMFYTEDATQLMIVGDYSITRGKEAEKIITEEMTEYGVTKEEINRITETDKLEPIILTVNRKEGFTLGKAVSGTDLGKVNHLGFYGTDKGTPTLMIMPSAKSPNLYTFTKTDSKPSDISIPSPKREKQTEETTENMITSPTEGTTSGEITQTNPIEKPSKVEPTTQAQEDTGAGYALGTLHFAAPTGYSLSSSTDMNLSFFDENVKAVFVDLTSGDTMSSVVSLHDGGEYGTIGKYSGYSYFDGKKYGFVFTYAGNTYHVRADYEDVLNTVVTNAN